ncbi:hypothetical protein [Deinococcus aerophilus]|uniref:Spore coat protein U domain-containing protein n=1 Tax=Deinococcus aerophilus TaxID=522488 RepID=A0ABQ2GWS2_9DEIO|nr:hypothetical protein [Deinococcus aerophilus]GGM17660.1 hypothetical protein GCM10010841_27280 [Deinococcus aerophilus]
MKKALMIAAMFSMTMANAQGVQGGRSAGSVNTALNFYMKVVPGCAVNLAGSYDSAKGATYNGTDTAPETVSVNTLSGGQPNFRCQTGTKVTITASALYGVGNTFKVIKDSDSDTAPTILNGIMSLAREGFTLTQGKTTNNDDKTLEGKFEVLFAPGNVPGGNGDIYGIVAAFTPNKGQFEPQTGDYQGTLNIMVNY